LPEIFTEGVQVSPETVTLKPGEYVGNPNVPGGPLLIVAALQSKWHMSIATVSASQRSSVAQADQVTARQPGRLHHTGKEVHHSSSIYKGARDAFMERRDLGWNPLHAGDLPGSPTHGASPAIGIFQAALRVTMKGATVIIATNIRAPAETVHPVCSHAERRRERTDRCGPI